MLGRMRYRFGVHELDTETELLTGPEGSVTLRPQTYRLLKLLIERAPALLTRDELMDELWGHHALSPNVVPQTVSELRQALGDDPQRPQYIETRHRRGYVFVATVTRCEAPLAPAAEFPAPAGPPPRAAKRLLRWPIWLAMCAALGIVGMLTWLIWRPVGPPPGQAVSAALMLELSVDDPALAAYVRQWSRAGTSVVMRPTGWQTPGWRLVARADATWSILDPAGTERAQGTLVPADRATQAAALIEALGDALGRRLDHPPGWPPNQAQQRALADAVTADADNRPDVAAQAYARAAGAEPGWVTLFEAEALARAGDWSLALARLQALNATGLRSLTLQAEALRARLAGRPLQAISAMRADALLRPESLDARLAVLDAELDSAQWDAAAEGLQALAAQSGDDWPPLLLRRAIWTSANQPAAADASFRAAIARAQQQADGVSARAARLAWARWNLERSQLDLAGEALAALADGDADAGILRGRLALEHGELDRAATWLNGAVDEHLQHGRRGEVRRARIALVEVMLRAGDPASAATQAQTLLDESLVSGDHRIRIDAIDALGRAQTGLGQFGAAQAELMRAIELAHANGDLRREATARYHLGNSHAQERQRPEEAAQAYRQAAESFRQLRDDLWETKAQANLALMAERAGRRRDARAAYQIALDRVAKLDMPREFGRIHLNAGINERELGDLAAAARLLDLSLAALDQAGAADIAVVATAVRVDLALLQGDVGVARRLLDGSETRAQTATDLPRSMWLAASARLLQLGEQRSLADQRLTEAVLLRQQAGVRTAELDAILQRLRLTLGTPAEARDARLQIERVEAEFLRLGELKYGLSAGLAGMEAELANGSAAAALELGQRLRSQVQSSGNRSQQLQLDWLIAQASGPPSREGRLHSLAQEARQAGFVLLSRLAERALQPANSAQRRRADAELKRDGLLGATVSAASAW